MTTTTGWRMPGPPEPSAGPRIVVGGESCPLGFFGALLWLVAAGAMVALLLPRLWPDAPPWNGAFWVCISWAALMAAAFAPHLGVGALAAAAVGLMLKRWRLASVAGLAGALLLAPAVMLMRRSEPAPPSTAADATSLCIMTVNLNAGLQDTSGVLRQIEAANPDVVLIQELTPRLQVDLKDALAERYPHRATLPRTDAFGQGVFSRLPFLEVPHNRPPGGERAGWGEPQIGVRVEFGGRLLELWNLHLLPPVSISTVARQHDNAAALKDMVVQRTRPMVLGGDFNSPREAGPVRGLLRAGLRSAHAETGSGLGLTWPIHLRSSSLQGASVTLPGVQIDHILYSPELECTYTEVSEAFGSDHRAVVAKLRWADRAGSD